MDAESGLLLKMRCEYGRNLGINEQEMRLTVKLRLTMHQIRGSSARHMRLKNCREDDIRSKKEVDSESARQT